MKKYLLLLFVFFLFAKCDRCKDAPGTNYIFELPIRLIPQQDTFRIGDTIRIISKFGSGHAEVNTGITYELKDFNFYFGMYISKIDSLYNDDNFFSALADNFTVIINDAQSEYDYSEFQSGGSGIEGEYIQENDKYSVEVTLVPENTGIYFFRHGIETDLIKKQNFEGRCKNHGLEFNMIMNGREDDNNSDYLYESLTEHFNTWIPQKLNARYHDLSGYCFYVVE